MPVNPVPLLQDYDAQGNATVQNLRDPTADGDATSKSYVDDLVRKITANAAQALSGHRAVLITPSDEADYPALATVLDGQLIAGITAGAAAQGDPVTIHTAGPITEPGWTWTPGPVFAGDNGVLTQTPPAGSWVRMIGMAVSPTKIIINLQPVILT